MGGVTLRVGGGYALLLLYLQTGQTGSSHNRTLTCLGLYTLYWSLKQLHTLHIQTFTQKKSKILKKGLFGWFLHEKCKFFSTDFVISSVWTCFQEMSTLEKFFGIEDFFYNCIEPLPRPFMQCIWIHKKAFWGVFWLKSAGFTPICEEKFLKKSFWMSY